MRDEKEERKKQAGQTTCTRDTVDKGLLGGRDAWSRTVVPVAVYTCTLYLLLSCFPPYTSRYDL